VIWHVTTITGGAVVAVSSVMRNSVYKCEILFLRKYRTKPVSNIARGVINPDHWDVLDVPCFDTEQSRQWFIEHDGELYDVPGLASTVLPLIKDDPAKRICSEAILASVGFPSARKFDPGRMYNLCVYLGGVRVSIPIGDMSSI
jgi:hypothetical protein